MGEMEKPTASAGFSVATTRGCLSHRLGGGVTGNTHCTPPPFVDLILPARCLRPQWGLQTTAHAWPDGSKPIGSRNGDRSGSDAHGRTSPGREELGAVPVAPSVRSSTALSRKRS